MNLATLKLLALPPWWGPWGHRSGRAHRRCATGPECRM